MQNTLQQISDSFDKVIADGFSFYASFYGSKWHVTLNKRTFGENSVTLDVKGDGETIFEAVERALNNVPKNPLDGSRWKSDRLAGPVEDATFTETTVASHS
jgi:hypothetical protein